MCVRVRERVCLYVVASAMGTHNNRMQANKYFDSQGILRSTHIRAQKRMRLYNITHEQYTRAYALVR